MNDAIQKAREALEAAQKRAEALHDVLFEAREAIRVTLKPDTPAEIRAIFDKLHSAIYILRGDPLQMHMAAILAALDAETPATPADVGELVERSLPSYGSLPFDELGRDVREAQIGHRDDFAFDQSYSKGHQMVGSINFNSLNRIVSKYAAAATALERVVRERDEAHELKAHARKCCDEAEAKLAEARKVIERWVS